MLFNCLFFCHLSNNPFHVNITTLIWGGTAAEAKADATVILFQTKDVLHLLPDDHLCPRRRRHLQLLAQQL